MFAKVLKGDELTQRLISCMVVEYNLGPRVTIGGMRDSASVNGAAMRNVRFFYVDYFDVVCSSHTIDNVGSHFELQVLDSFARFWIALFSHSYNAKLAWREKVGQSIRTHSITRWWSKWEVLKQALDLFADIEPFLRQNEEVSPANRSHLLEISDDPESLQKLYV